MSNKVIGIISYFPDSRIREIRRSKLFSLIIKCKELFENVPFIIIAQNWKTEDIEFITQLGNNIKIESVKNKLGITGARKYLREVFLKSSYDYLIMLDDDCKLTGDKKSGQRYLKQIDNNPNMFYEFNKTLLKLFAISKFIFEKVDYSDVNPETAEGFEDRVFVETLRLKFPCNRYIFNKGLLNESSISTKDVYSTWYVNQDIKQMLENTNNIINNIKINK